MLRLGVFTIFNSVSTHLHRLNHPITSFSQLRYLTSLSLPSRPFYNSIVTTSRLPITGMAHNPVAELASTLQSASIKRHPDPAIDLNPSTAASQKQPVRLEEASPPSSPRSDSDTASSPSYRLRPVQRKNNLPPLPDLRFEQSYLASIQSAESWQMVAYITIKDQFVFPLLQGTIWTLGLLGWRAWNKGASFSGATVGGRIRRWWYGVNNWKLPEECRGGVKSVLGTRS
jgi:hypothetical protein